MLDLTEIDMGSRIINPHIYLNVDQKWEFRVTIEEDGEVKKLHAIHPDGKQETMAHLLKELADKLNPPKVH